MTQDFTSSLSPSYMVRWEENGRQWEEEVAADKLNITDVFSNRESFVPKQVSGAHGTCMHACACGA